MRTSDPAGWVVSRCTAGVLFPEEGRSRIVHGVGWHAAVAVIVDVGPTRGLMPCRRVVEGILVDTHAKGTRSAERTNDQLEISLVVTSPDVLLIADLSDDDRACATALDA